jgi:cytochrome oxidase Cu insertion factor (SCO1/SenC/PrrC family)
MKGVVYMKRMISLLLMLLLVLTMTVGCGGKKEDAIDQTQNETGTVETGEEAEEDVIVTEEKEEEEADTSEFGIPLESDKYWLVDKEMVENDETYQEELDFLFGVSTYRLVGPLGNPGVNITIFSEENEAFIIKSIDVDESETLKVVLEKAKPGDEYAHVSAKIVGKVPFQKVEVVYEDGTIVPEMAELHLFKTTGIFKSVDKENKTISYIPDGSNLVYTEPYENIPDEVFDDIKTDDFIEIIQTTENVLLAVRKGEQQQQ